MKKIIFPICLWALFSIGGLSVKGQTITTVAGNGTISVGYGCCGNGGPATAAQFGLSPSVASDAVGNLYVADQSGDQIRKISTSGIVTVFAGTAAGPGYTGDGGPATAAYIDYPQYITSDGSGNLYFSEVGTSVVRKINTAGIISTYAGAASGGSTADGIAATAAAIEPLGLAMDGAGNLYICDYLGKIRKINAAGMITTVAGIGGWGYTGDGGPATAAKFSRAAAIALDGSGNLFIADQYNNVIRKVSTTGTITTAYGQGTGGLGDGGPATAAKFNMPSDLKFDASGNLFVADHGNARVRMINTSGIITTIAGTGVRGYTGDGGAATAAEVTTPSGLAFDAAQNLYIVEDSIGVVRKIASGASLAATRVNTSDHRINIFPNPNDGCFTISGNNLADEKNITFHISDMVGAVVYSGSIPVQNNAINTSVKTSALANGIYLLYLDSVDEQNVFRLVVQH